MYYETFGLNEPPFQLTPDSRYLFFSKAHKRAKAYMDYAVWKRDGFIVVTGEIGAGKTTLLNKLVSEIGDDVEVIRIFQTQLNETEFLQAMLFELGLTDSEIQGLGKVQLLHKLNHYLIDTYAKGRHVVLIVDEGQNLSTKVLEEVRMLSGLEVEKEKLINIILVGQPEMNEVLDRPNMAQLIQRIRLRFHLGPLKAEEMVEYIKYRLKVAGSKKPEKVFHSNTYSIIQKYTGGIPRKINVLCDTALVCAFADSKTTITEDELHDAISELQWELDEETGNVTHSSVKNPNLGKSIQQGAEQFAGSDNSLPSVNIGDSEWRDVFSSLLKVMGDVSARMQSIDKRLDNIDQRLKHQESLNKIDSVSSLANGKDTKRWSSS